MKRSALKLSIKLEPDFDLYEINSCTTNKIHTIFNQAVKACSEVLATFTETEIYDRNKHMTGQSRNSNKVISLDMSILHTQMTNVWLPSTVFEVNLSTILLSDFKTMYFLRNLPRIWCTLDGIVQEHPQFDWFGTLGSIECIRYRILEGTLTIWRLRPRRRHIVSGKCDRDCIDIFGEWHRWVEQLID